MLASVASASLAAVVPWAVLLGACTDDDSPEPPPPTGEGNGVALEISLGPGAGDLTTEARDDLQNDVSAVLSTYVVEGFLGDYPRDDFVDVLDTFTSQAARKAVRYIDNITGAGFKTAEEVVATRLQASISTFAPDREAEGVSAEVDFTFGVTEDDSTREVTVRGRLMLTPVDGQWKIFGFDLKTDDPASGAVS